MKLRNIIATGLLGCALFTGFSCSKAFVDPDINKDPNNPVSVSSSALLPSAQVAMGYTFGSDFSRFGSMFAQQITGVDRQFEAYNSYIFSTQDFDNCWSLVYSSIMKNLQLMIVNSPKGNGGYNPYSSIAKILMAYSITTVSDYWGDVPYSEAFSGLDKLQPKYDKQQDIYTAAQKLLADAVANLALRQALPGTVEPGADDIVFGGDINKWMQLGRVLQARLYIHVSKFDNTAPQKALDAIAAGGFSSNDDNFQVAFGAAATSNAPYYQFETGRGGYLAYNISYWANTLQANNDPRYPRLIDVPGGGGLNKNYYFNPAGSVPLATYPEQLFIQAEAYWRLGNLPQAAIAYKAGIAASMKQYGVADADAATYIAANGTLSTVSATAFTQIMTEKYYAMYLNPEVFTDWRRTGVPSLTPNAGTQIPRRFLYPQQEISYNAPNVNSKLGLYSKVWWDQ